MRTRNVCSIFLIFIFTLLCTSIKAETSYPIEAFDAAFTYAQDHWGPVQLFDVETYYNLDDSPNIYAFTFWRGTKVVPAKQVILNRIRQLYQRMEDIRQEIEQIKASSLEDEEKQRLVEDLEWELLDVKFSQRAKAEFCTVLCAADTLDIIQANSRLPRHLVQLPTIEQTLQKNHELSDFAPARIYYSNKFNMNYLLSPAIQQGKGIRSLPPEAASKAKLIRLDGEVIDSADQVFEQSFQTEQEIQSESTGFLLSSVNPSTNVTIVITHGFQLSGSLPAWVVDMAEAIREDLLGGAKIFDFDKSSGQFVLNTSRSDLSSGHSILIMDWAKLSNDAGQGYTESSGDALFQALLYGEGNGIFSLNHLHFIGHSRGAIVNGEAIERLLYNGSPVIQVTTLDPHDSGALGGISWTDYDANPTLSNRGVVSWNGIQWADNYYSSDGGLDGIHLDGTYETYFGSFLNHSEVHNWYHGTIDPDFSTPSDWYGTGGRPARNEGGYNHARTILNNGTPPSENGPKTDVQFRFGSVNQGIINGDFRRNPVDVGDIEHPGWHSLGGSGTAHIDAGHLELDQGSEDYTRTHNFFYIPPEATGIQYNFKIYNDDGLGTPKDQFQFLIDDIYYDWETLDYTTSTYETRIFSLTEPAKGTHKRITVRIQAGGSDVDSEVHIDDIKFVITDWPVPKYGQLTVSIYPSEVQSSARWRLTSGADTNWKVHGQTIYGLTEGNYTLEFNNVSGWQKPSSKTVTVDGKETSSGTYTILPEPQKYLYGGTVFCENVANDEPWEAIKPKTEFDYSNDPSHFCIRMELNDVYCNQDYNPLIEVRLEFFRPGNSLGSYDYYWIWDPIKDPRTKNPPATCYSFFIVCTDVGDFNGENLRFEQYPGEWTCKILIDEGEGNGYELVDEKQFTIIGDYQISSVADLQSLCNTPGNWSNNFILTTDLDCSGVALTPIGSWSMPFEGVFDGNGHKIRNVVINLPESEDVGLFGFVSSIGQIQNLGIENINITGFECVGGIVGTNMGTLTSCYANGSVSGGNCVGGLVGLSFNGATTITACYATGSVTGTDSSVGGLVGNNQSLLTSCYANGSVSGGVWVGGLVGHHEGSLISCYATALVSGTGDSFGGLVGDNIGLITSCFWDTQTSAKTIGVGVGTSTGVTGKTTAEMMMLSTFTSAGWDFVNTWWMPNGNYPHLQWEPQYTLSVNSSGASEVSITSTTNHSGTTNYTSIVSSGTNVSLTAPPTIGSEVFTGWTGDVTSSSQTISFTMNGNMGVTAKYITPPPAPTSINYPTSSSTGNYTVSWSASSTATSYRLERSSDGGSTWSQVYSGPATSYQESVGNGSYRYRVRAERYFIVWSDWKTGTWDCVVLLPPTSISYPSSSSTGNYTVSWSASSTATSYRLERSSDGGSTWSQVYSGPATSYQESVGNGSYRYQVRAERVFAWSGWRTGTWNCVVLLPPPAPTSINYPTSSSTGSYTVSWSASSTATSYRLERSSDGGSTWSYVYSGPATSYQESVGNGSYRYRVRASNASGSSGGRTGMGDCVVVIIPQFCGDPQMVYIEADLNRDCHVDLNDLTIFCSDWLRTDCYPTSCPGDINYDGMLNLNDFMLFSTQWLECNDPMDATCF